MCICLVSACLLLGHAAVLSPLQEQTQLLRERMERERDESERRRHAEREENERRIRREREESAWRLAMLYPEEERVKMCKLISCGLLIGIAKFFFLVCQVAVCVILEGIAALCNHSVDRQLLMGHQAPHEENL